MLKREKEFFQYMLDNEEQVIKALEKHYRDALNDINLSIRIMQGDELTQSKVYQIQYQQALKKQVEGILERLHAKEYTTIQQYLSDSYTNGFVGSMYSMHGQGIPLIASIDQNAAVKAVITDSQIREGLYDHLAGGVDAMKKAIRAELTRGIASNMKYEDIARNIAYTTKAPLFNTKNIVRTEGHRIQQASADDARHYAASRGADMLKQWDATLDGNTRKTHRELDGTLVGLDEEFVLSEKKKARYPGDFGYPEEDCQCRCVALDRPRWALDEAELETLKERAAYFKLDKTKDFQDFKEKYLEAADAIPDAHASNFTPANSIAEAEEYAQRFVEKYKSKYTGNVSFKGMDLEYVNKVNKVLTETYDRYDVPVLGNISTMNFRESKWKNAVENGIAGAYQWSGNGGTLYMNQKIFANQKTMAAFEKKAKDLLKTVLDGADDLLKRSDLRPAQRKYIEALKKSGCQCFGQTVDDFAESVVVHEIGHSLEDKVFRKLFKEAGFDVAESMAKYGSGISGYAVSNAHEYIAESFSAYWYGKMDILDPDLIKIFRKAEKTTAKVGSVLAKSDESGSIISGMRFFTGNSKDYPTIFLPKNEYAHVMSEINTHITAEQRESYVFSKAIGDHIYTVENNGFGDYRIIGKKPIDTDRMREVGELFDE